MKACSTTGTVFGLFFVTASFVLPSVEATLGKIVLDKESESPVMILLRPRRLSSLHCVFAQRFISTRSSRIRQDQFWDQVRQQSPATCVSEKSRASVTHKLALVVLSGVPILFHSPVTRPDP